MTNSPSPSGAGATPAASGASRVQPWIITSLFWEVLGAFAVVVVIACPAIWAVVPAWYTRLAGAEAQGTVYRVRDCGLDDDGDETYAQTVLFQDAQGQLQESTTGDECSTDVPDGDTISLWYLPDLPGNAFIGGSTVIGYTILAVLYVGAVLWALSWFLTVLVRFIKACMRSAAFARHVSLMTVACLVPVLPVLVLASFFPPPKGQLNNGPAQNYHLGETVLVGGQWSVTIQSRQFGLVGGQQALAATNNACLELDITLRNITHQSQSLMPAQFTLYSSQRKVIKTSCSVDTPRLANISVAAGQGIQKALAYLVPANAGQVYLAFRPGTLEANVGRYFWRLSVVQTASAAS